jgi:dihydroorotase
MELTFPTPDDMHLHLRDDEALAVTVPMSARQFARAIVMPNLKPSLTTTALAQAYRERILAHVPAGIQFEPLMTLYLSPHLSPDEIQIAKQSGIIFGVKLYPQGATTNSEGGLKQLKDSYPVFAAMEEAGLPLLIHGEAVDPKIDIFDREKMFIDHTLIPIISQFPKLKIVLEHITTQDAVNFILEAPKHIGATITAHHLMYNRTDMLSGGLKPHLYCMPILKGERHREALVRAATSGNPKFFLGTDSAPHEVSTKLSACGCAGVFSAPCAIEAYATIFDQAGALHKLPDFASRFGADFYGLPHNKNTITLFKEEYTPAESIPYLNGAIVPMCAGKTLSFSLKK